MISAVRLFGVNVPVVFESALYGELFALYAKFVLASGLCVGGAVLMDSLSVHKVAGVLDPVFERGLVCLVFATLFF